MTGHRQKMLQAATAEVRLDPDKSDRFSSSVPSNDRLAASIPAAATIHVCPRPPKRRSLPQNRPESGECRVRATRRGSKIEIVPDFLAGKRIPYSLKAWCAMRDAYWLDTPKGLSQEEKDRCRDKLHEWDERANADFKAQHDQRRTAAAQ